MDAILFLGTVVNIILVLVVVGTWNTAVLGPILAINGTLSLAGVLLLWKPKVPPRK